MTQGKMLTKEQIFEADDLETVDVPVPEWGGRVRVRTISGSERDRFEQETMQFNSGNRTVNLIDIRARFCVLCLVDEAGKRLFNESEIRRLGQKSGKALDRVFDAAQKLNGLSETDLQDLAKNSVPTPDDDSISS